jgi:hypothetical protein
MLFMASRQRGFRPHAVQRLRETQAEFLESLTDLPADIRREDAALDHAARAILRRITGKRLGKRPIVEAHILRL